MVSLLSFSNLFYSDGRILNQIINNSNVRSVIHPNLEIDVTDSPELAYYNRDMVAIRPISEN